MSAGLVKMFGVRITGSVKKKGRRLANACLLGADFGVAASEHKAKKAVFVRMGRRSEKGRISPFRKSKSRDITRSQAVAVEFGFRCCTLLLH